jgi:4-methyl-5(b-hydroxyethyl)-thiazole monophosphate biosynthesis
VARVLIPLAPGFEEIEAITVIDILRRAGIEVVVAGLRPGAVSGSHQIRVMPDLALDDVLDQQFDMIALPGGMPGADNLEKDPRVMDLLRRADERGAYTAAICAAPKVLAAAGLLENRRATSYPGFLDPDAVPGMELADDPVVQDDRRITSRGPGTAMDFALSLVENLAGPGVRKTVEDGLQRPRTGPVPGDREAR